MWLMTPSGFYSVVGLDAALGDQPFGSIGEGHIDTEHVLVRGRVREDMEALCAYSPEIEISEQLDADYRYRCVLAKSEWAAFVAGEVAAIDYSNFKGRVSKTQGAARHDLYLRVWTTLLSLDERVGLGVEPSPELGPGDAESIKDALEADE